MRVVLLIILLIGLHFEAGASVLQKPDKSKAISYIELLKSDSDAKRQEGKMKLLQLGDEAISPLLPLLDAAIKQSKQIWVIPDREEERKKVLFQLEKQNILKKDVMELLGRLQAEQAIPALIYSIDERNLRGSIILYIDVEENSPDMAALVEIGAAAVPELITTINGAAVDAKRNEDGGAARRTQTRLAIVLGEIGDRRALSTLEELYEQKKESLVLKAIKQIKEKNHLK